MSEESVRRNNALLAALMSPSGEMDQALTQLTTRSSEPSSPNSPVISLDGLEPTDTPVETKVTHTPPSDSMATTIFTQVSPNHQNSSLVSTARVFKPAILLDLSSPQLDLPESPLIPQHKLGKMVSTDSCSVSSILDRDLSKVGRQPTIPSSFSEFETYTQRKWVLEACNVPVRGPDTASQLNRYCEIATPKFEERAALPEQMSSLRLSPPSEYSRLTPPVNSSPPREPMEVPSRSQPPGDFTLLGMDFESVPVPTSITQSACITSPSDELWTEEDFKYGGVSHSTQDFDPPNFPFSQLSQPVAFTQLKLGINPKTRSSQPTMKALRSRCTRSKNTILRNVSCRTNSMEGIRKNLRNCNKLIQKCLNRNGEERSETRTHMRKRLLEISEAVGIIKSSIEADKKRAAIDCRVDDKAEEQIRLALEEERTRLMGFRTIYRNIAPLIRTLFADPPDQTDPAGETRPRVKQEVSSRSGMEQGGVSQAGMNQGGVSHSGMEEGGVSESWAMSQRVHSQTRYQDGKPASGGKRRPGRPRVKVEMKSGNSKGSNKAMNNGNSKGPRVKEEQRLENDKGPKTFKREALCVIQGGAVSEKPKSQGRKSSQNRSLKAQKTQKSGTNAASKPSVSREQPSFSQAIKLLPAVKSQPRPILPKPDIKSEHTTIRAFPHLAPSLTSPASPAHKRGIGEFSSVFYFPPARTGDGSPKAGLKANYGSPKAGLKANDGSPKTVVKTIDDSEKAGRSPKYAPGANALRSQVIVEAFFRDQKQKIENGENRVALSQSQSSRGPVPALPKRVRRLKEEDPSLIRPKSPPSSSAGKNKPISPRSTQLNPTSASQPPKPLSPLASDASTPDPYTPKQGLSKPSPKIPPRLATDSQETQISSSGSDCGSVGTREVGTCTPARERGGSPGMDLHFGSPVQYPSPRIKEIKIRNALYRTPEQIKSRVQAHEALSEMQHIHLSPDTRVEPEKRPLDQLTLIELTSSTVDKPAIEQAKPAPFTLPLKEGASVEKVVWFLMQEGKLETGYNTVYITGNKGKLYGSLDSAGLIVYESVIYKSCEQWIRHLNLPANSSLQLLTMIHNAKTGNSLYHEMETMWNMEYAAHRARKKGSTVLSNRDRKATTDSFGGMQCDNDFFDIVSVLEENLTIRVVLEQEYLPASQLPKHFWVVENAGVPTDIMADIDDWPDEL